MISRGTALRQTLQLDRVRRSLGLKSSLSSSRERGRTSKSIEILKAARGCAAVLYMQ